MRLILCTIGVVLASGPALAEPASAIAFATAVATAIKTNTVLLALAKIVGSVLISVGGSLLLSLFQQQPAAAQASVRTRKFETHPPYRIPIGEFPQEGNVVFQHVDEEFYYFSILLSSIPIDGSDFKVWLNDVELDLVGNLTDMTLTGGAYPETAWPYRVTTVNTINRADATTTKAGQDYTELVVMYLNTGGETQFPQDWIDYLEDDLPDIATASWEGCAVLHVRLRWGDYRHVQRNWGGRPIPPKVRVQCKWAKLYDPRLDTTSGVSGASGSHRIDTPSTWEWSANPAIAWLNMAVHEKVLARPHETIVIQMVADAADDCDTVVTTTGGSTVPYSNTFDSGTVPSRTFGVDPGSAVLTVAEGTGNVTGGALVLSATSNTINIYFDLVELGLDPSRTYTLDASGGITSNDASTQVRQIICQGDAGANTSDGYGASNTEQMLYGMPPDAKNITVEGDSGAVTIGSEGLSPIEVQGRYISWAYHAEPPPGKTVSVLSLTLTLVDKTNEVKFRCDGLVVVESREWDLLRPIEESFAATRDSTGGVTGIRAGIYTAPTVTLNPPVASTLEYVGRTDPGADNFIGVYLSRLQDYQEAETGSYAIRTGDRTQTIEFPFVREQYQAERLTKIYAERAKRNRSVTGLWPGQEYYRRIGEPVTFDSSPLPMMDGTYRVSSERVAVEPVDGGVRFRKALALIEEASEIYDYDHATDFPGTDIVVYKPPPVVSSPGVPQNLTAVSGNDGAILDDAEGTTAADYTAAILVTWEPSTGSVDEYEMQYSTNGGSSYSTLPPIDSDATTTLDTGTGYAVHIVPITAGLTYTIRVRAVGPTGESAWATTTVLAAAPTDPIGDFLFTDFDSSDFG